MTTKKMLITASFILAMGASSTGFAETKTEMVDGNTATIECVTTVNIANMTEEDKAKLTLPICENLEKSEDGATTSQ